MMRTNNCPPAALSFQPALLAARKFLWFHPSIHHDEALSIPDIRFLGSLVAKNLELLQSCRDPEFPAVEGTSEAGDALLVVFEIRCHGYQMGVSMRLVV